MYPFSVMDVRLHLQLGKVSSVPHTALHEEPVECNHVCYYNTDILFPISIYNYTCTSKIFVIMDILHETEKLFLHVLCYSTCTPHTLARLNSFTVLGIILAITSCSALFCTRERASCSHFTTYIHMNTISSSHHCIHVRAKMGPLVIDMMIHDI